MFGTSSRGSQSCLLPTPHVLCVKTTVLFNQSLNHYFIVRPKVDQRDHQLCLSHIEITGTERNKSKA